MTYFDQAQEELEYEFNARYDYISEAYAGMQEDPRTLAYEAEADAAAWQAEQDAFIGPVQPLSVRYPLMDGDIPF